MTVRCENDKRCESSCQLLRLTTDTDSLIKLFSLDTFSLLGGDRAKRKRQQVENIVTVLTEHGLDSKSVVVDFGSGSGNLCLALASVFTLTTFVFVDMNQTSLDILSQRSRVAGLTNVKVIKFRFTEENLEEFLELIHTEVGAGMDLGIGLHCCGSFTDLVLDLCRLASSDCLIIPCCNGKIDLDQASVDILLNFHYFYQKIPFPVPSMHYKEYLCL